MKRALPYIHALLTVLLGAFFIYAGVKKFINKPRPERDNTELVSQVQNNTYEKPYAFSLAVKSMKVNGMLYVIGIIQILAGLFMLVPRTRLLGLALLLPIILNIFLMHVFMDNRMDENIETGAYAGLTLILILYYYQRLKLIFVPKAAGRIV